MIAKTLSSVLCTTLFGSLVLHVSAQDAPTPSVTPSPSPAPSAQPGEHHWTHPGPEEMMSRFLQLTDDQKKQIKPIMDDAVAKGKQLLEDTKQKVRGILTPEQQAKLDTLPSPIGNQKGPWPHMGMAGMAGMPGMAPGGSMPPMSPMMPPPGMGSGEVFRAPMMPALGIGMHPNEAQAFQAVTEGLNLSPEQRSKVAEMIKSQEQQIKTIQEKAHLDVSAIVNNAKIEILPILTPAQLQILADKAKLEADEAAVLEQGVNKK